MAAKKIQVKTHDGKTQFTTVDNYNPKDVMDQMADEKATHVIVGDIIVHKSTIAGIGPAPTE